MPPDRLTSSLIHFGVFEVDLRTGELRRQGVKIKLQDQPFRILAMLLERPAELVTREEIRQCLWPADTFVDFDHGLNNAISRLRAVLHESADNPRFIETLPRKGYRFIAPVRWDGPVPPAPLPSPVPVELTKPPVSEMAPPNSPTTSAVDSAEATKDEKEAVLRDRLAECEQRAGSHAGSAERLVLLDIQVFYDHKNRTCLLDFRVSNKGGSELTIERVSFEVSHILTILRPLASPECCSAFGFKRFSKVYGLDIRNLTGIGDRASCRVCHIVKSGECDRFGMALIASNLGTDVYRSWKLLPTLSTSIAKVNGREIEVWLPRKVGNNTVSQAN